MAALGCPSLPLASGRSIPVLGLGKCRAWRRSRPPPRAAARLGPSGPSGLGPAAGPPWRERGPQPRAEAAALHRAGRELRQGLVAAWMLVVPVEWDLLRLLLLPCKWGKAERRCFLLRNLVSPSLHLVVGVLFFICEAWEQTLL